MEILMKIHGLQKMTLLDFPGHVACTVFLGGCDLRCPYCHNYELATGKAPAVMEEEELFSFLAKRTGLLDGVAITGGEPCLHQDLPDLLERIRGMGFAVKLDTNGTHPDMLRAVLSRGLADYVAMDIKNSPGKYALTTGTDREPEMGRGSETGRGPETDRGPETGRGPEMGWERTVNAEPAFVGQIRESVRLLMESGIDYEFRTTVVDELHQTEDFEEIGRWIKGAKRYFLQCFADRDTVPYAGLSAPSKAKLEACAAIVRPFVEDVQIRGID